MISKNHFLCFVLIIFRVVSTEASNRPSNEATREIDAAVFAVAVNDGSSSPENGIQCNLENCGQLLDDVIRFVENGLAEIKVTDEEKATIVVGLTGTGKSTMVQFYANESNILTSVCVRSSKCTIRDEKGDIGDSIISKTLLPNLVEDDKTNGVITAFYDMPGFDDNRNESVEIANSFFIKHVVENSKSVGIVILSKYDHLSSTDKKSFPDLVMNVLKLVKDPKKYSSSISMMVNMADYNLEQDSILWGFIDFLREFHESIDDLIVEDYRDAARDLLEILLENDANDYPIKVGFMRTPRKNGTLTDDPVYIQDRTYMKNIIYNLTTPTTKRDGDFGYSITSDAKLVLVQAQIKFTETVTDAFEKLSISIIDMFEERLMGALRGEVKVDYVKGLISALSDASYEFLELKQPPTEHLRCIFDAVNPFAENLTDTIKEELISTGIFLDYIYETLDDPEFNEHKWVISLQNILPRMKNFVDMNLAVALGNAVTDSLETFASDFRAEFPVALGSLRHSAEETDVANVRRAMESMTTTDYGKCMNKNLMECKEVIISTLKKLNETLAEPTVLSVNDNVTFITYLSTLLGIEPIVDTRTWVTDLNSIGDSIKGILNELIYQIIILDIQDNLGEFSIEAHKELTEYFDVLVGPNTPDFNISAVRDSLLAIVEKKYPDCLLPYSNSMECAANIKKTTSLVSPNLALETNAKLNHSVWFINFALTNMDMDMDLSTHTWLVELNKIEYNLIKSIREKDIPKKMILAVFDEFGNATKHLYDTMVDSIDIIKDVLERDETLQATESNSRALLEDLQKIFSKEETQISFAITEALSLYKSMYPNSQFKVDLLEVSLLEILGNFEWHSVAAWANQFINIVQIPLSMDAKYSAYLVSLSEDLVGPEVHVTKYNELQSWWAGSHSDLLELRRRTTNFGFKSKNIITDDEFGNMLSTSNKARLEALLQFSLEGMGSCPSITANTITFQRKFLSTKFVTDCLKKTSGSLQTVVVIATHTAFIDDNVKATDISAGKTWNLFIGAPILNLYSQDRVIDVSGVAGKNGENPSSSGVSGTSAGNVLIMYNTRQGGSVLIQANGGKGGNGADGSRGSNGNHGEMKSFWAGEPDCVAWKSGDIQIRTYDNSCNGGGYEGACSSGQVFIYGTKGSTGGNGGTGGNAGSGGSYGIFETVVLKADGERNINNGTAGTDGLPGRGGIGGTGGQNGNTLEVWVYSVHDCLFCGYHCQETNRGAVSNGNAKDGSNGNDGIVSKGTPVSPGSWGAYIEKLKTDLTLQQLHPFFGSLITRTRQELIERYP